jgi:hypothetical protein
MAKQWPNPVGTIAQALLCTVKGQACAGSTIDSPRLALLHGEK